MKKRLFLLIVVALACTLSFVAYGKVTKILAIGNSFSEDAVEQYLYELALEERDTLLIANAFRAGQGLESHWNVATQDKAEFQYRKVEKGVKTTQTEKTLLFCLQDEEWDYITFQQSSPDSGLESTYEPFLTNLLNYAKQNVTNPDVIYGLHQTWAYAEDSGHSGFMNYGRNQQTMYNAIVNAVNLAAKSHTEDIGFIVPAGTAIQNGRSSFIGDNFNRDGYHLSLGLGRYTAACTWLEKITGKSPVGNKYFPVSITEVEAEVAQHAAHAAIVKPNEVTPMNQFGYPGDNTTVPAAVLKINVGAATVSAEGWNNVTTGNKYVAGLKDTQGNDTEIIACLDDEFSGTNAEGVLQTTTDLDIPEEVAKTALWGYKKGTFGTSTLQETGGILFSHLNKNLVYDFYLFGSRKGSTDNRETEYVAQGENRKRGYSDAAANTDRVAVIRGIKPTSTGEIRLTVTAGANNTNSNAFYYLNAMQIEARPYAEGDFDDNEKAFHVVPGGSGEETGADWDNAFDLTTENLAKGGANSEFWVKAGEYTQPITVASTRQVYGGFDGTETKRDQRDWATNRTIIKGNNAATSSLLWLNESSVADGFYIQDNQNSTKNGGGVTMMFKTTLRNCVVRNNSVGGANVGGGVFVTSADKDGVLPTIENCLIHNNTAADNGGGIQVIANGKCHLINSTVANNKITKAHGTDRSGYGCGVGIPATASIVAENSVIANNGKPNRNNEGILYLSFGANYNQSNNGKSSVSHSAYDATNNDSGANTVTFIMETNCINDLSEVNTPGFVHAPGFIGCVPVTSTDEYGEINHADYRLSASSMCIDKGENVFVAQTTDLAGKGRIYNATVDLGAYEYIPTQTTGVVNNSAETFTLYVTGSTLVIAGLNAGDDIAIYNTLGKMIYASPATGELFQLTLPSKGIYIVKRNSQTAKFIY